MLTLCLFLLSSLVGSKYLKSLHGPMSKMLQMLQECSQLELALRVLLNTHGSCLQHITSNMMNMNVSMQVRPAAAISTLQNCSMSAELTVFHLILFQLYEKQVLMNYNVCLNEIQKNTSSTLSTVAVALLNKASQDRVLCFFFLSSFWFVCF